MPSLKDVKMKIVGVRKTKQITKAMNMVASAKLRGAQTRIERFRPYAAKFRHMLSDLAAKTESNAHPLLSAHAELKVCLIILVTSDRGLCGSFNGNIIAAALRLAREKQAQGMTAKFICVGKKGRDAVRKTEYETILAFGDRMGCFDFSLANTVAMEAIDGYQDMRLDEAHLVYGEFVPCRGRRRRVSFCCPLRPRPKLRRRTPAWGGNTSTNRGRKNSWPNCCPVT